MIIIEGCDNTGKSTLAEKLSKDLGIEVQHSVRPDPSLAPHNIMEHAKRQLRPRRIILDRVFAISEYVYGRVIRGQSLLKEHHGDAFMELYQRQHMIIYCRPSDKVIQDNKGRDQMEGVVDNFPKIIAEYDDLIKELEQFYKGPIVCYDYTSRSSYGIILELAKIHLKNFDSQAASATFLSQHKGPVI